MATSVLSESLRLLLLMKTAIFSVSDTSIAQDLNAQQACREAQDLCRIIISALERLTEEVEVNSSSSSDSCASDEVSVYLILQIRHLRFFFCFNLKNGFAKSAAESAADTTTRTVKTRVRSILACTVDGSMVPKDLAELLEVDPIGPRQCVEDSALVQLYRGYPSLPASSWVRSFAQIVFRSFEIALCRSWL